MTRRFLVVGLAAAGMGTLATIVVFELVPDGEFGPTLALAREFLPWGIAVSMVYVISQILADLAGFALRPPVTVGIRLTTVGLEWAGIFIGALHGPAGLVAGWAVGLSMATLVWLVATFSPIEISSVGRDYAGPVG